MKNVIFAVFYTLGLSAFFPFFVVNHRSSAAWPMFLAPIVGALLAEVLARTVRFTKERNENRVIWLIASFILLVQVGRYALGLDAFDAFTEYLALNALYQIVVVLIFAASEKRAAKGPEIGQGRLV
jgi:hypothetical protein